MISLLLAAAFAAKPAPAPAPVETTWHLEHLFKDVPAFETERAAVDAEIDKLPECRTRLGADAAAFKGCLDRVYETQRRLAWLYSYASNHAGEDTRDDAWQERDAAITMLAARFSEATSWLDPAIVALGSDKIEGFLKSEPGLAPYAYPLRATIRQGAHVGSPEEERLIALADPLGSAPHDTFETLVYAEIPWPSITTPAGETVTLAPTKFTSLRADPDPAFRKKVFDTYFGAVSTYEGTLGGLLGSGVAAHWYVAQARDYPSCVEAAVGSEFVPRSVYDTLITETHASLPTLHRYFALRKRMIGVDELTYADLYVPLVASDRKYTLADSTKMTLEATRPLGKGYTDALQAGFDGGWMDVYPHEGKRGGAYVDGSAYGAHPYVLLNHQDDYDSATTLAHEWGHAMHSHLATEAQPYATSDYSTFVAEVASTFNEALLLDVQLKNAKTDDERLFYLGTALEQIRTTYYRQAMFAEFELAIHEKAEKGEPITGSTLTATYAGIVRNYVGADKGVVRVDDVWTREWAAVPHFYYDFYVYQYATSIAASSLLADRVLHKDKGAVDGYLALLKAGGSDDPYLLLKRAGVDMATPEPYRAVAKRMDAIMDEVEVILAKQGK